MNKGNYMPNYNKLVKPVKNTSAKNKEYKSKSEPKIEEDGSKL